MYKLSTVIRAPRSSRFWAVSEALSVIASPAGIVVSLSQRAIYPVSPGSSTI